MPWDKAAQAAADLAGGVENVVVLGIGNLLWADEGFGVRAVQELHRRWRFPKRVTLVDGGTQGYSLLHYVQAADKMIIFDAVDFDLPPGNLKVLRNEHVPRFMGAKKLSLHQTGFQEVLAIAELNGQLPNELVLIGVQPEDFEDYGGSLRPVVRKQIEPALELALANLLRWRCEPEPRGAETVEPLLPTGLDLAAFEMGCSQLGAL
ncbi:MAG: HyaD/HybD family hydrogenase maturation endopeptidase [Sulfuricella sp.]|nr:HyaD/HybD family hydrogenase maturation endopeptidase [Sulfuricella sp.]